MPYPRVNRPLLIWSSSRAAQAVSNGERTNAIAIPVSSFSEVVEAAATAKLAHGGPYTWLPMTPTYPRCSNSLLRDAMVAASPRPIGAQQFNTNWILYSRNGLRSGAGLSASGIHRRPRINRAGRAPVNSSFCRTISPATRVALYPLASCNRRGAPVGRSYAISGAEIDRLS